MFRHPLADRHAAYNLDTFSHISAKSEIDDSEHTIGLPILEPIVKPTTLIQQCAAVKRVGSIY